MPNKSKLSQISLSENAYVSRTDTATILTSLSNAKELSDAQTSLEALNTALISGDKADLVIMLASHAALLDALFKRLLTDAEKCKSESFTVTVLELALKTADTARKTVIATNDLVSRPAPQVAIQINA